TCVSRRCTVRHHSSSLAGNRSMNAIIRPLALALLATAGGPLAAAAQDASEAVAQDRPALSKTTIETGLARAPEQEAVAFEHADLAFRVDPAQQRIDGDATLTFRATRPLQRLVVDLDRNYTIASVAVDGQALPASAWSNPEGRMTVTLPATLAEGDAVKLRIVYGGKPHVATRVPWDGGFVCASASGGA